jgi:hypothetical protein
MAVGSKTMTIGLWATCTLTDVKSGCMSVGAPLSPSIYAHLTAARIFIIISCILSSFSVLSILSIVLVDADSKRIMALLAEVFSIGSLIAGIIGVTLCITLVLKNDEMKSLFGLESGFKIGVSSFLGIIGVVFNLAGTVITFIIK